MVETSAYDTYFQQYDWTVVQVVAVYFPNDNHVRSVFLAKFAEHAAYEAVVHHDHLSAVESFVTVNVEQH